MTAGALVVAEMTLRGILRRRGTLALLALLPLAFYLARHELVGQSIRFVAIGLAWAASTVALFAAIEARGTEARLLVGGWSLRALVAGRVAALLVLALALAGAYLALLWLDDRPVAHEGAIALVLLASATTAVALGTAIGAIAGREVEGALAVLIVAGLQFMADPAGTLAHLLPFWSTRELATYAVDGTGGDLGAGLLHAAVTLTALTAVTAAANAVRRRRRA